MTSIDESQGERGARDDAPDAADAWRPTPSVLEDLGGVPDERTDGLDGYAVKLAVFEGPLDLLLHLIRQNEVDITDIPIARIAEQYLATIELMQELDLDVAAEYLVMAATLALIKSRMLLPGEAEEEEEGVDPRADLVQRLLEYQRFKEVSEQLGSRLLEGRDVFAASPPELEPLPDVERPIAVSLVALLEAFRRVLAKSGGTGRHEVLGEPVHVGDRMRVMMEALGRFESLEFERLFELEAEPHPTRRLLIATFLALLELVRLGAVRVYQGLSAAGVPGGPIRLRRAEGPGADDWKASVAEIT
jgi:segregation and condensation protein A